MTSAVDKPAPGKPTVVGNKLALTKCTGEPSEAARARVAYDPAARAASVGRKFIAPIMGEHGLANSYAALNQQISSVKGGDLSEVERKLVAQADTLDAIFNDMARRAALNAGEYLHATETYMRLALKAQSQCRATIETLANIKNPPVVIAKQANIAGGAQQVNNGVTEHGRAHAGKNHEIRNQPHVPEAARPNAPSSGSPLLCHEQALPVPVQSPGYERMERVQVPRSQRRRTER